MCSMIMFRCVVDFIHTPTRYVGHRLRNALCRCLSVAVVSQSPPPLNFRSHLYSGSGKSGVLLWYQLTHQHFVCQQRECEMAVFQVLCCHPFRRCIDWVERIRVVCLTITYYRITIAAATTQMSPCVISHTAAAGLC